MLWFFITAYAVMLGAGLNARLERFSAAEREQQTHLVTQQV